MHADARDSLFLLVHGAFHGAWCWEPLAAELARLGHASSAVDLPVDDPLASQADYARVVERHLQSLDAAHVHLVGHSLGGMIIPRVAHARVASRIYLCAALPARTQSEHEANIGALQAEIAGVLVPDADGLIRLPRAAARWMFVADVEPTLAEWALDRLRPQSAYATILNPDAVGALPGGAAHAIYTTGDPILKYEESAAISRERLGVEHVAMAGGHSPFLTRPRELAELLARFVA